MGLRANVVTKYVCEYGWLSEFGNEAVRVWKMLVENGVEIYAACTCGSGDACYYGQWAINGTEALLRYIATLETLPPNEVNEYFDTADDRQDYTNQSVKEILEEWVSHCDATSGVIRIHWL